MIGRTSELAGPLYLGFDLSTQQLKGLVIDTELTLKYESSVSFDADLSHYGITKGVLTNPDEGEIYAPNGMWLEAIELVLNRLRDAGCDLSQIQGLSGAGMQHGTVFWSSQAEELLANLDASRSLVEQLEPSDQVEDRRGAFSHPHSPNWQDASTQKQCDAFDKELGSPEILADVTGSKAHHRFSGPQIMRWRTKYPSEWKKTSRISLVSSFIASIFLGKIAPIDIGDVCGMNLWHIHKGVWHEQLLKLAAGPEDPANLKAKLGPVPEDGGLKLGEISPYFVQRYGFSPSCSVIACTGDNPSTILALPLQASDAIVSLGTSTTFLMSTPTYKPSPAYHFMNHPTTAGLYMFMLCYKNGGLAREQIRDALSPATWDTFNSSALSTPPLSRASPSDPMKMGLYFPRHEIVPNAAAGQYRFTYAPSTRSLARIPTSSTQDIDPRLIVESQMLSLRLRSQALVTSHTLPDGTVLPPQPRRVYLVGGASANPAIARIAGDVLGGVEGVFKLDIGGNACALGAAHKAAWGCERGKGESFEDFVRGRWDEGRFVRRICDGYRKGVWEGYGEALDGFGEMEREVEGAPEGVLTGGVVHVDRTHEMV